MSHRYFYKDLPYVEDIKDITNDKLFRDVPIDWYVLICDIQDSTIAIEEGKYKEVNFIASCAVTAIQNIDKYLDFPFVFGGDGASILIPQEYVEKAKGVLMDTKRLAKQYFNLNLRIGAVPVIDILRQRHKLRILKLKVAENYFQCVFMGGGVEYAEKLVRGVKKYQIRAESQVYKADFKGLQCIWQDIPSKSDEVVSLLVKATNINGQQGQIYNEVMGTIYDIYGTKEARFPVNKKSIRIRTNIQKLYLESLVESYQFSKNHRMTFLKNIAKHYVKGIVNIFKFGIVALSFNAYRNTIIHSIESEKFDDMLKMVISGTKEQRHQLVGFLEEKYQNGELAYGLHTTASVHMTCLIFERKGRQVHFIDGSNAGYTLAAKEFKNRLRWQQIYMQG